MLTVRKAKDTDKDRVIEILKELDIYYSALKFRDFWVAEEDGEIIGCAQLEEYPDFFYLGSVGVTGSRAGKGTAKKLLDEILKGRTKDIYLYTIIPDFFRKFAFEITEPVPDLPSRDRYECEDCHLDRCVAMVKRFKGG